MRPSREALGRAYGKQTYTGVLRQAASTLLTRILTTVWETWQGKPWP